MVVVYSEKEERERIKREIESRKFSIYVALALFLLWSFLSLIFLFNNVFDIENTILLILLGLGISVYIGQIVLSEFADAICPNRLRLFSSKEQEEGK